MNFLVGLGGFSLFFPIFTNAKFNHVAGVRVGGSPWRFWWWLGLEPILLAWCCFSRSLAGQWGILWGCSDPWDLFFRRLKDSNVTTLGSGFFSDQAMWELLPLPLKLDRESLMKKIFLACTPVILVLIVRDFCWVDDTIFLGFFSVWYLFKKNYLVQERRWK